MNTLVIYDSQFGNTEKIALVIAKSLGSKILNIREAKGNSLRDTSLLVIGSPTQGGRPTKAVSDFIKAIPSEVISKKNVAIFDTRLGKAECAWALKMLMNIIGFASEKMARTLKNKGANLVVQPEGFIVMDSKGPLKEGETDRAKNWSGKLLKH